MAQAEKGDVLRTAARLTLRRKQVAPARGHWCSPAKPSGQILKVSLKLIKHTLENRNPHIQAFITAMPRDGKSSLHGLQKKKRDRTPGPVSLNQCLSVDLGLRPGHQFVERSATDGSGERSDGRHV